MEKTADLPKNKKCSKCGIVLKAIAGNFYRDRGKKDGLSPSCSECCRKRKSETYSKITSPRLKKERLIKKEIYLQSEEYKRFKEISKQKNSLTKKRYQDKNRELLNLKARLRPKRKISSIKRKEYKKREYLKMKSCPYKKHVHYLRTRMASILNESRKDKKFSVSGSVIFNREQFISHIESLFLEGMSWDNYGRTGWHIDHIRPLASFNTNDENWYIEAFSLKNLQPLWASENCAKGSLYNGVRHTVLNNKSTKK